jgi:hypothetical protein
MAVEFRNPTEPKLTGSVVAVAGAVKLGSLIETPDSAEALVSIAVAGAGKSPVSVTIKVAG